MKTNIGELFKLALVLLGIAIVIYIFPALNTGVGNMWGYALDLWDYLKGLSIETYFKSALIISDVFIVISLSISFLPMLFEESKGKLISEVKKHNQAKEVYLEHLRTMSDTDGFIKIINYAYNNNSVWAVKLRDVLTAYIEKMKDSKIYSFNDIKKSRLDAYFAKDELNELVPIILHIIENDSEKYAVYNSLRALSSDVCFVDLEPLYHMDDVLDKFKDATKDELVVFTNKELVAY